MRTFQEEEAMSMMQLNSKGHKGQTDPDEIPKLFQFSNEIYSTVIIPTE